MKRIKWIVDGYQQRTACHRFVIQVYSSSTYSGYELVDKLRKDNHVCRTIESAKTAARNLMLLTCHRCGIRYTESARSKIDTTICEKCHAIREQDALITRLAYAGEWK